MADLIDDELREVCERVRETTHRVIDETCRTIAEAAAERAKRAESHLTDPDAYPPASTRRD